jgi:hypothetical protein
MTRRIAHAAPLVALALALVLVPAAFAGKNGGGNTTGGGSGSGLSLVMVTDNNGDGLPNWGDTVTFKVSTTVAYPMVQLVCYQGSTVVDNQTVGFYVGWPWSKDFPLYHWYYWPSGGANCTATLYYQTRKGNVTLATLPFQVNA